MTSTKIPEYILLSELIQKIKDKEYYQVFAKTLLMTTAPDKPIPADNELVKEMFQFFIKDKQLKISYKDSEVQWEDIESELASGAEEQRNQIWEQEIFVKVKDLKKLYANRCIVLPNSLFVDKNTITESL